MRATAEAARCMARQLRRGRRRCGVCGGVRAWRAARRRRRRGAWLGDSGAACAQCGSGARRGDVCGAGSVWRSGRYEQSRGDAGRGWSVSDESEQSRRDAGRESSVSDVRGAPDANRPDRGRATATPLSSRATAAPHSSALRQPRHSHAASRAAGCEQRGRRVGARRVRAALAGSGPERPRTPSSPSVSSATDTRSLADTATSCMAPPTIGLSNSTDSYHESHVAAAHA